MLCAEQSNQLAGHLCGAIQSIDHRIDRKAHTRLSQITVKCAQPVDFIGEQSGPDNQPVERIVFILPTQNRCDRILDDIGAITIIALFYTGEIDTGYLMMGGAVFIAMLVAGRLKVASSIPYVLLAILMWAFILRSGVHATLAGVAAALTVPMAARNGERPLEHMEHALHPWVAFLVIPIFGFANAGVTLFGLDPMDALAPLPLGIALGLLIGKQAGILGFAWLAVKTGIASLPESVNWRQNHGLSLFAAIGFTMSLFIGNLAFASPEQVDAVKLGVLSGSTIAAIAGFFLLRSALPTAEEAQAMADPEAKAEPAE